MRVESVPRPEPGPGKLLVAVRSAGINPVDWKIRDGQRRERMPLALPVTLGCDLCGTVIDAAGGAGGFTDGDEVIATTGLYGAFADVVAVDAAQVAPKPVRLDPMGACCVPLAALTAWQALHLGGIAVGQTVLVHAAAGGVGSFAVQIARALGARVVATASAANAEYVRSLGAAEVIDPRATRFEEAARDLDLVLDLLGGEAQDRSWGMLRPGGALISTIAVPAEDDPRRAGRRAARVGVRPVGAQLREIVGLIDANAVGVHVDAIYPMAAAADALEHSKRGHVRGKIALRM